MDGISNTQTINPDALGHDEGERVNNLVQVMVGYFEQGAHHLNVNVFGTEKLIDAMEHPEKEEYAKLLDQNALEKFRNRALNPMNPEIKGTASNDDIYFQATEARNRFYNDVPDIVNEYMQKINEIAGTHYEPFQYYGSKMAKNIIIAMGSVCETIKETIDYLNGEIGLIEVHLYRPFSEKYLFKVIPDTVKNIAVLDRTKEPGSIGEPLYLDIVLALKNRQVSIVGGRYGLSSKNVTPGDIDWTKRRCYKS